MTPLAEPIERHAIVNGQRCRLWQKGEGKAVGFLAGFGGLPRWAPFLDHLAQQRRVIAPSLPGFPGGLGHTQLDDLPDWIAATLDLLEACELDGADLVAASVGGMLAAEVASLCRPSVRRLALLAPLGLFSADEPVEDVFARLPHQIPELLCSNAEAATAFFAQPEASDPIEWQIETTRANEAAARLLWPLGERGLAKRLHRVRAETLLLWGAEDAVVPASYAKRFADGITGTTRIRTIAGAGHLAYIDEPEAVAEAVLEFLDAA
jgi:pimeloyl-ACP methyl ester carboxylesterase